jgi:uncharacterized protein YbbC (DUF1343 family)
MKLGIDVFLDEKYSSYSGERIGLVTNMTGVNKKLIPSIDLLNEHPNIRLTALFGPEHGIRGDAKEGEEVSSSIDPYTGLPIHSLYGKTRKPTKEMLADIDVMVFDLQDIGARYYTYIYTLAFVMEACQENGKKVVVLDRPNPINGRQREGNLVLEDFRSFVGGYPLPNRHGLTIGEIALLYQNEFGIHCELEVIPMAGWTRDLYFDETGLLWVQPSPNSTGQNMSILYPGTCLLEGTNISGGRGTTRPFEVAGAPFIDGYKLARLFNEKGLDGVIARPTSYIPTYEKYQNELCSGIQLHVTDKNKINSFKTGLYLLESIAALYPEQFTFLKQDEKRCHFNLLAGTDELMGVILEQKTAGFLQTCEEELDSFETKIKPYLLY